MNPLLVIKTGSAMPELTARRGDFEHWIAAAVAPLATRVVDVVSGEPLPRPEDVSGVIVTGSSAMVSDREAWSECTADWLRGAVATDRPVLGICYGHQLLAHAFGGRVGRNPRGREVGTIDVTFRVAGDPLLDFLPVRARFQASHVESVLELPPGIRPLAWSRLDPHHALRFGRVAWGVQFHPEFDADVSRSYVSTRRDELADEGLDPDTILAGCGDAPHGTALLARFAALVAAPGDVPPMPGRAEG
jgi:GMP synthase (glutamine-hydrolysing)